MEQVGLFGQSVTAGEKYGLHFPNKVLQQRAYMQLVRLKAYNGDWYDRAMRYIGCYYRHCAQHNTPTESGYSVIVQAIYCTRLPQEETTVNVTSEPTRNYMAQFAGLAA